MKHKSGDILEGYGTLKSEGMMIGLMKKIAGKENLEIEGRVELTKIKLKDCKDKEIKKELADNEFIIYGKAKVK